MVIFGEEFWDVIWTGLAYLAFTGIFSAITTVYAATEIRDSWSWSWLLAWWLVVVTATGWMLPSWFAMTSGLGLVGLGIVGGFAYLNR